MFPSLAFHGFYITQGNNYLIVPSAFESVALENRQVKDCSTLGQNISEDNY